MWSRETRRHVSVMKHSLSVFCLSVCVMCVRVAAASPPSGFWAITTLALSQLISSIGTLVSHPLLARLSRLLPWQQHSGRSAFWYLASCLPPMLPSTQHHHCKSSPYVCVCSWVHLTTNCYKNYLISACWNCQCKNVSVPMLAFSLKHQKQSCKGDSLTLDCLLKDGSIVVFLNFGHHSYQWTSCSPNCDL